MTVRWLNHAQVSEDGLAILDLVSETSIFGEIKLEFILFIYLFFWEGGQKLNL
jgi:hypothetical protein